MFGLLIVITLPVISHNGNLVDNLWITLRACARSKTPEQAPMGDSKITARYYGGGKEFVDNK